MSLAKVHIVPAVEATSMAPSAQGPPAVAVVKIVEARAATEAARPVVQPTVKVPALSAKVPDDPAVEATLMNPLLWGPLSWPPGSHVDNVIEIVVARAAAEAARPVV